MPILLLEHDAKLLLAERGIATPRGALVRTSDSSPPHLSPPWIVKAQVPVGGRGKAGGIVKANDAAELAHALNRMIGSTVRGHAVRECRIEEQVSGRECYVSVALDAASGRVDVLLSASGGVDVEAAPS